MAENDNSSSIWVEKWRGNDLNSICLTAEMKNYIENCIKQKNIPHLLFFGRSGIGKTTLGKIIANELGADMLYLNGSLLKSIDVLRNIIMTFVTTYSDSAVWSDSTLSIKKLVFIDEMEKITFQESLKVVLEENQSNCRFILATNNISAIIDAIKDERCHTFNLEPQSQKERKLLAGAYFKRLLWILDQETFNGKPVKYDPASVKSIVIKTFPSMRKAISTCEKTILTHGEIGSNIIFDEMINSSLIDLINKKDVIGIRKFCANTDPQMFFREFYENFDKYVPDTEYINVAAIYGEYSWRNARHDDREQNLFMFLVMLATKLGDKFKIGK